mgnify:CR=1 FL=1
MKALTSRQQELVTFINDFTEEHGWAPTITEMRDGIGTKHGNSISCMLKALETKRYIKRGKGARCVVVEMPQSAG